MLNESFVRIVDEFKWESEEQKQGYLSLTQYERKHRKIPKCEIDLTAAFFIQKNHEAHEWWAEAVGSQINMVIEEIRKLQSENMELKAEIQKLRSK